MKCYQRFSVQTDITAECLAIANQHWDFSREMIMRLPCKGDIANKLVDEFASRGLTIEYWSLFCRPPFHTQAVHADMIGYGKRAYCGLNIPISGWSGSKMQWFKEPNPPSRIFQDVNHAEGNKVFQTAYFKSSVPVNQLEMVDEVEIDSPMLVNVWLLHRVISGPSPRIFASIRFKNNPKTLLL